MTNLQPYLMLLQGKTRTLCCQFHQVPNKVSLQGDYLFVYQFYMCRHGCFGNSICLKNWEKNKYFLSRTCVHKQGNSYISLNKKSAIGFFIICIRNTLLQDAIKIVCSFDIKCNFHLGNSLNSQNPTYYLITSMRRFVKQTRKSCLYLERLCGISNH